MGESPENIETEKIKRKLNELNQSEERRNLVDSLFKVDYFNIHNFVLPFTKKQRRSLNPDQADILDLFDSMNYFSRLADKQGYFLPKKKMNKLKIEESFYYSKRNHIVSLKKGYTRIYDQGLESFMLQKNTRRYLKESYQEGSSSDKNWPKLIPSFKMNISDKVENVTKNGIYRDITTKDTMGITSDEKYKLLLKEIKQFSPILIHDKFLWSEDFTIFPKFQVKDELRTPPRILRELFRENLYQMNSNEMNVKYPARQSANQMKNRNFMLEKIIETLENIDESYISAQEMLNFKAPEMPPSNFAIQEDILRNLNHDDSIRRKKFIKKNISEIKFLAFENSVSRHFEAISESVLEMFFQFFLPFVETLENADNDHDTNIEKNEEDNLLRSLFSKEFDHKRFGYDFYADDEMSNFHLNSEEDGRKPLPSNLKSNFAMPNFEHLKSKEDSHDKNTITWEHILFAIQSYGDNLVYQNKASLNVHELLPQVNLSPQLLDRVKNRLMKLFCHPNGIDYQKILPDKRGSAFLPPKKLKIHFKK